jgi:catechol 2,3-dioxygenase
MAEKGVVVGAHLRVPDLERAVGFYTETLGLTEQSRGTGVSRLSTPTQRHDQCPLTLRTGERGLDRVAVGVGEATVHDIESRLTERGTAFERRDGTRGRTIAVTLPGGLPMQFHSRESDRDETQTDPSRAPRGIDHITVASPDVRADAEFLRDELGFRLFDVAMAGPGIWGRAFARRGDGTHDVALLQEPLASSTRLHHVAWRTRSVDHVTKLTPSLTLI